jgi:hypothetical protein
MLTADVERGDGSGDRTALLRVAPPLPAPRLARGLSGRPEDPKIGDVHPAPARSRGRAEAPGAHMVTTDRKERPKAGVQPTPSEARTAPPSQADPLKDALRDAMHDHLEPPSPQDQNGAHDYEDDPAPHHRTDKPDHFEHDIERPPHERAPEPIMYDYAKAPAPHNRTADPTPVPAAAEKKKRAEVRRKG